MKNSLEDFTEDVIRKAQKGLGVSDQELEKAAGGTAVTLEKCEGEDQKRLLARKIAQKLSLNEEALIQLALKRPRPFALIPENILVFHTPFHDSDVNSYLLIDDETKQAAAFDTGTDATELLKVLQERGLTLKYLFLTHSHGDHIFDMDRIVEKTGAEAWIGDREQNIGARHFTAGHIFDVGLFSIDTRLTTGHTSGGITYVTRATIPPVAFVGDAIFASSIGGAPSAYQEAIRTNREFIYSLPNESLLFPGHGPVTSVGLEKKYNPFYQV